MSERTSVLIFHRIFFFTLLPNFKMRFIPDKQQRNKTQILEHFIWIYKAYMREDSKGTIALPYSAQNGCTGAHVLVKFSGTIMYFLCT